MDRLPPPRLRRVEGSAPGNGAARDGARFTLRPPSVLNPSTADRGAAGALGLRRAAPSPDLPPLRSLPESTLWHGYRGLHGELAVVRSCACGEPITYDGGDLAETVAAHQQGDAHQSWRDRGGMRQPRFDVMTRAPP